MTASTKKNALSLAAISTLAMGVFWAPAFRTLESTGYGDWQWFHHMWEAGRTSIVRWGEVPLFDPHHCGGVPLWGNPQAQVYSPTWAIFALPFGTAVGHKLYLLAHAIVGHAGFYVLSRRLWGFSVPAAFLAATLWASSGFFAWHGAGGHATFISFYWAPWLLLSWRRAEHDLRHAAAVALIMAVTVAEGGHYPFPYFVLWLGFDLILRLGDRPRSVWPILRGALLSGGLAALLCAYRIVPILLTVLDHPHEVVDNDALTPSEILFMLTSHEGPGAWPHRWVWNEYGGFIGWGALGLAGVGALMSASSAIATRLGTWGRYVLPTVMLLTFGFALSRSVNLGPHPDLGPFLRWIAIAVCLAGLSASALALFSPGNLRPSGIREPIFLLLGALFYFLLTQGAASEHHPWPLLQELPFYRSIHVPSRFRVLLTFYLAGLAGVAFDGLRAWLATARIPRPLIGAREALPFLVLMGIVVNLYVVNLGINDRWDGPVLHQTTPAAHFYDLRDRYRYLTDYADYPHRNVGTSECYDPIPWVISPRVWSGEEPQVRIEPPDAGRVIASDRTSRTLWAEVELTRPATLVFNQSTMPGFEVNEGTIGEDGGLMTVALASSGTRRVRLRYAPRDLPWVVGVSLVGLVITALVARGSLRRLA